MEKNKKNDRPAFWGSIRKNIKIIHNLSTWYIPISVFAMLLDRISPFISMILGAKIVDMLVLGEPKENILPVVYFMVGSLAGIRLFSYAVNLIRGIFMARVSDSKNRDMGIKAMGFDYEILERNATQETISKADSNSEAMGGFGEYVQRVIELLGSVLSCIAAFITMLGLLKVTEGTGDGIVNAFFESPISYVVLMLIIIVSVLCNCLFESKREKIRYDADQAKVHSGRIYWFFFNLINDYPLGKDIRIFQMQKLVETKGSEAYDEIQSIQKRTIKAGIRAGIGSLLSQNLFIILAYLFVGIKTIYGMISIGDLMKYGTAITLLQAEIGKLLSMIVQLNTHNMYLESYSELMSIQNEKYKGTLPVEKRDDNEYELEFRNVSFHYPNNDRIILNNVSFCFKEGEKLAIVGANGAGKTTFIKLLCRLYDPTEGEILLNGIDIRKYDYDEYIKLFSIVFQDYKIFAFSVAENVAAGPDYDEECVIKSLREAGIYERVMRMKDTIHTQLLKDQQDSGEEGIEISGGEKQKIALARALYRDAPLVILDEPTSALDPLAEQDIYTRFNDMVSDKTAVFISHRMSSCRFCDRILVFENGSIAEQGSHEQLVANENGLYHKMWNAQSKYYM